MKKAINTALKSVPPYIQFATFKSFLTDLHNTTVPPRIDSSVTPRMSGQTRGALVSCLKFLGLIMADEDHTATPILASLVGSIETEKWPTELGALVVAAYDPIVRDLNLTNATGGQLAEAFRKQGQVEGQVLEKCMRFFLSALDEAGLKYSQLFKTRGALTTRKRTPKKTKNDGTASNSIMPEGEELETPLEGSGLVPFVVPFPDKPAARFWLPKNLTEDDWNFVDTVGRAYVKRNSKIKINEI